MSQCKRLPPGWDSKLEPKSGKCYFVNYFTRNVTLDDPRAKENIEPYTNGVSQAVHENGRPNVRHVPLMGASAVQSTSSAALATMNETVAKIRTMFPTVPETHIKALLIKYHGREAVVVSALQVEKHPVRTPGPFTPPPPVRIPLPLLACRPQPKPHSPKMKLRYLKSVFPVVEETLLLDTLCSADNNVTHATERLLNLGFNKRDVPQPRVSLKKVQARFPVDGFAVRVATPEVRVRSAEEKRRIKERLCRQYTEIAERVVSLALDSASYNEETADAILNNLQEEKLKKDKSQTPDVVVETEQVISEVGEVRTEAVPISPIKGECSYRRRNKGNRTDDSVLKTPPSDEVISEPAKLTFVSPLLTKTQGPNRDLRKGPNESLLLEDYVAWMGAQKKLAKGTDRSLVRGPQGGRGPDTALRKGSVPSLAKGSIYAAMVCVSGSRGN